MVRIDRSVGEKMDKLILKRIRDETLTRLNRVLEQSFLDTRDLVKAPVAYAVIEQARRPQPEKMDQNL